MTDTKSKNKLLLEVFRQSEYARFDKFLDEISDEDGVIHAEILFEYKKAHDRMYKEALDRVNKVGKPVDKKED